VKTAFAIAAHPDDIEFLMAGTLLLLREAGYQLHYMTVANGCCGSMTLDRQTVARIRRDESRAAAAALGAVFHESVCDDLEIFYDKPTLAKVAAAVREADPEIVLTHSPVDYMEDHMNASRLAVTAAFARGMPLYPTDPPRPPAPSKTTVYHAQPYGNRDQLRRLVQPDFFVNTTDVIEGKVALLSQHASQKKWLDDSQGIDSYLERLRQLDAEVGRMSGRFAYAEGWRRHSHLGFCDEQDDPLCDALRKKVLLGRPSENSP
jgi:LmbE family N-acetylglucosaminyl deacetylase